MDSSSKMDEGSKGGGLPAANTQTRNSGPTTINDLPQCLLTNIFNNLSPLTKLNTLSLVSKAFHLATHEKAAWTSVKAIVFTDNDELDLNDRLQLKLPVSQPVPLQFVRHVSSERIERYKILIGCLSGIRFIRPGGRRFPGPFTEYKLLEQLNLFTLRKHIGTLQDYDASYYSSTTSSPDDYKMLKMQEIRLLNQGQVKVNFIHWVTGHWLEHAHDEYARLLSQLDCSRMSVWLGTAAHLDSELGRSLRGKSISSLCVHLRSVAELHSAVELLNGLSAGSLNELQIRHRGNNHDAHAHIYKRINDEQLQSLKQLLLDTNSDEPNDLIKFTLLAIVRKTPNLECIELRQWEYDRLNVVVLPLWQLRIDRGTALTQTELTILSPDVSQFANLEQLRANLNTRLGAAENGVGLGGGLAFATAQINQLLESEWRVRIREPTTNTELSLRFVHQP